MSDRVNLRRHLIPGQNEASPAMRFQILDERARELFKSRRLIRTRKFRERKAQFLTDLPSERHNSLIPERKPMIGIGPRDRGSGLNGIKAAHSLLFGNPAFRKFPRVAQTSGFAKEKIGI